MSKILAASAVLAAPCAAFVPQQGSLRTPSSQVHQGQGQVAVEAVPSAAASVAITAAAAGAIGLGAASLAAAGAASKQRRSVVSRRVAGVCLPLTEKWDPLNLGNTDSKMERYTAVEIKHGRVAMIATIGYVMPEVFRFPGCEGFGNGLSALSTIPAEGWLQLVGFVGFHEIFVKPRAGGMGSYDLGFGTELLEGIPDEELERRQTVERNNGRLAMIGIMGLMVQDGMFGNPIQSLSANGFWGPPADKFVQFIPICQGSSAGTQWCAMKPAGSRVARSAGSRVARRGLGVDADESFIKMIKDMGAKEIPMEPKKYSQAVPFLTYPEQLDGWVGGEKGFDPLGVTDALDVYFCREAELKHGRVCMLATVGWIATDLGARFPGEIFQNVSTIDAHNKMVEAGIMGPFLATIAVYEVYAGWLTFEGFEGRIKRDAGDFFLGKNFLPKDPEQERLMRLKELENGRLAMLAFSGICTQAVLTKSTWPFL